MLHELIDEPTGLEAVEEIDDTLHFGDELAVRSALIRVEQLKRDVEQIDKRKRAVAESYDRQLAALEEQIEWLRSSVQAWLERQPEGKIRFPDVGTAYLAGGKPKIRVVDRNEFRDATAAVFVKQTWDETWAKRYALERALEDGEILPGVELVPGGPELRLRSS